MQPTDGKRFRDLLRGMARAFGSDIDTVTLDVYWLALSDWTLEEFETAAAHLLRNSKFMPRPAEFNALKKAGRCTAAEAWDAILRHCKGAYREGAGLDNDGPIDTAVRGLGGYRAIAMHDTDYLPIMQRQFVERYQESCDVIETREAVPQLADMDMRPRLRSDGLKRIGASRDPQ